jgi:membrane fusion protein (multidrug efflux system)
VAGRQPLTANVSGTASQIHARAGQSVEQGAPLVTLYAESERALLERVSREFDLQLVKLLRDPSDQAARDALAALNAERDLARNQLEQRTLRAPRAGIVSDLRVRIGQHVAAGDVVLSLTDSSAACVVVALLPGHYRPQLAPGMPLRLELDGYRYVYRQLTVDAVTQELIGPAEIGRYIGTDTVPVAGPTLLLSARLPGHTFAAKGREYDYYDGMRATARVRVQGESLLVTLLPALRALSELGRAR